MSRAVTPEEQAALRANDVAQRIAYDQSRRDRFESAKCLLAAFDQFGVPATMLDVGCGPGHLVKIAAALGVEAVGIDLHCDTDTETYFPSSLVCVDLAQPAPLWLTSADLVLCLEVAEHLPPSAADTLCDTLAAATSCWLLFSAATPGQGGSGHLNEQPHDYWAEKFQARGLGVLRAATRTLRERWAAAAPNAWWYGRNVLVLARRDEVEP